MAFISDTTLDAGLQYIRDNAEAFHLTSQQATTYTEAVTTYTLGVKTSPTITAQANYGGTGGGRQVTVATFTDGTVTATGTATHWALVDVTGTELLATGALTASQGVTDGNPFSLTAALPIAINDAVAIS